jgi:hypothetical protein
MPANSSDRERLLRLIDGNPEILEEAPKEPKAPDVSWRSKPIALDNDLLKLIKLLAVLALVFACLHYGSEALKTMKRDSSVSGWADLSAEDESGAGLRLVGVDSSDEAPVALLENLKSRKTYFARLNDRVGDARVTQIQKNRVLISVRGKTMELR